MASLRKEVLALYRELLRLSRKWNPADIADTQAQREYIERETRYWFRKNRHLTDEMEIKNLLQETRKRIEIAEHYGIAYERPAHYPTGLVRKVKKKSIYPSSS